jgi:hypothetical protein
VEFYWQTNVTKSGIVGLFYEIFREYVLIFNSPTLFNSTPLPDIACDQLLPFTTLKTDIFLLSNDLVDRIAIAAAALFMILLANVHTLETHIFA